MHHCLDTQDIVAGLPEEMLNRYSGYVYFPFMVSPEQAVLAPPCGRGWPPTSQCRRAVAERTHAPIWPLQDQGHAPLWFEPYLQRAQRTTKRYVMEDRFSAIRAAIGTAGAGDVVVIAGRGHVDFMEYGDGEVGA